MFNERISVIVRFHDATRIQELERALLSLLMQSHQQVEVVLVTQRFDIDALTQTDALIKVLQTIEPDFVIVTHNFHHEEPKDARSALLNAGMLLATGRYLAFLDYDDVMQPNAYQLLISRLQGTKACIAFGGIASKYATFENGYSLSRYRKTTFMKEQGLTDLLDDNHCPIHSFVIDRGQIDPSLLAFNEQVQRAEDYHFLLKICAQYISDFFYKSIAIGDYYIKDDGSNTVVTTDATTQSYKQPWQQAAEELHFLKNSLYLSRAVQASLGLTAGYAPLSIGQFLAEPKPRSKQQYFHHKLPSTPQPDAELAVAAVKIAATATPPDVSNALI